MNGQLVTVFGGSGFIGKYVVRALCKKGARVRVALRRPHLGHELRVMGDVGQVQLVQANVRDRTSVERAMAGADAAVNLVGVLTSGGKQSFKAIHVQAAEHIAEAAAAAGVGRLVHVSAIGADDGAKARYARSKRDGERAVRAALPDAIILRPSIVFGPEDDFFNRFADMARYFPALPLFRGGRTKFQPVYVGDVADAVVAALGADDAPGRVYELGGPRVYSFKELLSLILEETDRRRVLVRAPWVLAWFMGLAGEAAGLLPFVDPFFTRDQLTLLGRDNVVGLGGDGVGTLQDLGVEPDAVEPIVPTYLERYRRYGQFHESAA